MLRIPECHPGNSHGARGQCKPCYDRERWSHATTEERRKRRVSAERWAAANPERRRTFLKEYHGGRDGYLRRYHLKKKYNMTLDDYSALVLSCGSRCSICLTSKVPKTGRGSMERWFIDHDHKTGRVRGILCNFCNLMVGYANDNPAVLLAAVEYLNRHGDVRA